MDINFIIDHIRNRPYMSGVDRDRIRVKQTEEIFTPTDVVIENLNLFEKENPGCFSDPTKTFIDNCGGDGQWLGEVLIRKIENGIDFETALSTIYGVDTMQDNVELCRERLLCGREDLRHIVTTNIVCHNALEYDYSFNGTNKTDEELRFKNLFEIG
jgi:hypothetical protein